MLHACLSMTAMVKRDCVDAVEILNLCRPVPCRHLKTTQLLRVGGHMDRGGRRGGGTKRKGRGRGRELGRAVGCVMVGVPLQRTSTSLKASVQKEGQQSSRLAILRVHPLADKRSWDNHRQLRVEEKSSSVRELAAKYHVSRTLCWCNILMVLCNMNTLLYVFVDEALA